MADYVPVGDSTKQILPFYFYQNYDCLSYIPETKNPKMRYALQFALRIQELLYLRKLVVKVEAFRVKQRPRRLDDLSRNNLLHRQLHFLHIYGGLGGR